MTLLPYIARRLAWTVVATFLVLSLTFGALVASPDPGAAEYVARQAQQGGDVGEARETYRQIRGQDRPLWVRYRNYMVGMATLDWGWSETRSQPVTEAIARAWPYSAMYAVPAVLVSTILGIAAGLYAATHRNSPGDYAASSIAFFGVSVPDFWFAVVLVLVFGVGLGWIPVYYRADVPAFSLANARQLVAPALVVALSSLAGEMRYSRATALEYVSASFVKAAKARGASSWRRVTRHVLRPALVPLSTILVADLLNVAFVSSYVVEVVFGIPGLGLLSYRAAMQQDVPLVLATVLVPTLIAVLGNLLQDVAYTMLDPRIEYGDSR
jgi:peptide/nickel transport system permease protein